MAYDKLCDSAVLDAGLKQIADAIREKGGTSGNLAFPTAMAEAIAAIQAGGNIAVKVGSVTFADTSTVCDGYTITHDMGVIPTVVFLYRYGGSKSSSYLDFFWCRPQGAPSEGDVNGDIYYTSYTSSSMVNGNKSTRLTENTFTVSGSSTWKFQGSLYRWMALANMEEWM